MSDLNAQTMPRKAKDVKAAFVPKLDAFLFADFPNIELKILAMYLEMIGGPSMADVFREGRDLHCESAAGALGIPVEGMTDEQRQIGKTFNFSIVYGGGMPTLMRQLEVTAPEALSLLQGYHGQWPGIGWSTKRQKADPGTLIHMIESQVAATKTDDEPGYIKTLYGRHLHPRSMHSALNALCQGCAADLMKWAMEQVHDNLKAGGYRSHMVNTVHDELMLDCAMDEIKDLSVLVPQWMTDPRIQASVPIVPDPEWSPTTWADKRPCYPKEAA